MTAPVAEDVDMTGDPRLISELAIKVKNLSFSFSTSDGRRKPVLFDINLDVEHGSRLLLM